KIYDELARGYTSLDFRKSIFYNQLGLDLSKKNNNEKKALKFYTNLGAAYYRGGVYDTATQYLEKALPLARQQQNYRSETVIYVTYGAVYQVQSLYNRSLESYLNAAKILEGQNDPKGLCSIYS